MRHFSLNPALSLACLCAGLIPASLLAQTSATPAASPATSASVPAKAAGSGP